MFPVLYITSLWHTFHLITASCHLWISFTYFTLTPCPHPVVAADLLSVSLLLFCYIGSFCFWDSTCKWKYAVSDFLWLISLSIAPSRSTHGTVPLYTNIGGRAPGSHSSFLPALPAIIKLFSFSSHLHQVTTPLSTAQSIHVKIPKCFPKSSSHLV